MISLGFESETERALREAQAEIDRLLERQRVHLEMIASLSHSVPLPSEAEDWPSQRAALLAEVGTLRAAVAARDAVIKQLRGEPCRG